jgi:hypothetical protein
LKGTKEETIDFDLFFSDCELSYFFVARSCVYETNGVAWCELFHDGCNNSNLFGFS